MLSSWSQPKTVQKPPKMAREALKRLQQGFNWLPRGFRRRPKECKIASKKPFSRWKWQASMQNNSWRFLIHTLHLTFHSSCCPAPQIHNPYCTLQSLFHLDHGSIYDFQFTAFPLRVYLVNIILALYKFHTHLIAWLTTSRSPFAISTFDELRKLHNKILFAIS